jgi:hypothetical protein
MLANPFQCLTALHIARLIDSLARWHATRDAVMYGSQLGQMVGEIIRPITVRECGGLKAMVERELGALVAPLPEAPGSDVRYRILVPPDTSVYQLPSGHPIADEHEVAGVELWRLFANPRLTAQLAASPAGEIVVAAADRQLSAGKNLLRKLTSEDYRLLAGQFAAAWPNDTARQRMQASLQVPEFYNGWIEALRQARTPDLNPLKQWEITRAEHVARTLGEQLIAAGVDSARAADIVANARPSSSPRGTRIPADSSHTASVSTRYDKVPPRTTHPVSEDTAWMRDMLHLAIDKMSLDELREIRVPAGLLLEVTRQRRA